MNTLNSIAENIAFKLGDQFNMTLRESIKDTVLNYRAKFIRDDLVRNPISELHFVQTISIQFEVVNLLTEFNGDFSCITSICPDVINQDKYKVLRSVKEIPTPVRTTSSGRNPFIFLGRIDGSKSFTYTTLDKYPYIRTLKYSLHTIYYTIINRRIYIINNLEECNIDESLKICNALLRSIFEDVRDAYNACDNSDKFIDDMEFPIGRDMLMQISNAIIKGEYPLVSKDGQSINIKPDDND